MDKKEKAYLELALGKAIVGSTLVVGKFVVASFPVFLASALRLGIASAILVPLLLRREKGLPSVPRKDLLVMFLQAFLGVFLFSIALLYGLKLTTAIESGIITSATPAIAGLASFLILKERLTWHKNTGILLTVLGVLAINIIGSSTGVERGSDPLLGNLLIFGAVIGEALFITFGKIASEDLTPLAISTIVSVFGFLMFLPFSAHEAESFNFASLTFSSWLPLVYYGAIGTAVALVLWHEGVQKVTAGTASVFTGFLPISAMILSFIVLKEPFAWSHLVGIVFIFLGIGFMSRESTA